MDRCARFWIAIMADGILTGIRVLDLTRMLSGPYCTMMLADHGAEVVKIESAEGDTSRGNGPWREDDPDRKWAGYFVSLNRSKRSVSLDLESEEGKAAFRALAATADVVVENFRPGVMERLGLSWESLREANPALVYAAIRGFGDPRGGASPYADWPAYDVVAQAMGGLMAITGPDADTPTKVGPGVGDIFSGMTMAFGIMAALRHAEATGEGQFVDLAMYDAVLSLCERAVYLHDMTGEVPGPEGNGHPFLAPFGLYPVSDGSVALGIVDDAFWRKLAQAMDRPDLADNARFATRAARATNRHALDRLVTDWTTTLSKGEMTAKLGGLVPFGPMNTMADIAADPHVAARGMLARVPHPDGAKPWTVAANPLKFSAVPTPPPATPPRIGEHTQAYLAEMPPEPASDADRRALRDAFGCFATGVTVVTTRQEDGTPRGFTANSFTSVSLDPPLLLVCVAKSAHSCPVFTAAPHFAVNVLAQEQKALSGLFASRAPDKFERAAWRAGVAGMPVFDEALAHLVCEREKVVDAGDHVILLGRVIGHATGQGQPLGYFRGTYFSPGTEQELVDAASQGGDVEIGALIAGEGTLLLAKAANGGLEVPKAPGGTPDVDVLTTRFRQAGLTIDLDFLYAVYRDSATGRHGIFYHGTATGTPPQGHRFYPIDGLPLTRIRNAAERSMLTRYAAEHREGAFGIYQGDENRGTVHRIASREPSTF